MQIFFDFFPIILFFISFKLFGIYIATIVAIVTSLLQTGIYRFKHKRFEFMHLITLAIVVLLGGATILLHDIIFIKWKPTILYWTLALVFLGTHFLGEKKLIQRMMESKLVLPKAVWNKLNLSWMIFFFVLGIVNLYVVYNFTTNAWVNFKLFGTLGLTTGFVLIQSLYMAKYVKDQN